MKGWSAFLLAVLLGLPAAGRTAELDLSLPVDVAETPRGGPTGAAAAEADLSARLAGPVPPASGRSAWGGARTGPLPYGAGYEARHPGGMRGMGRGRGR